MGFYKRAYQHLQVENGELREEIVRLQDKDPRAGGHTGHMLDRSSPDGQDIDRDRADCEERLVVSGASEEEGQMNGDETEITRWRPKQDESSSAVPELITLEDVPGDHTATLQLNNAQCQDSEEPEKLEDLYQDITKNVLKKIVNIRNLKNS